jgi:flagellar biosynthetic protein FliQ
LTPESTLEVGRMAVETLLWVTTPIMLVALVVGLVISLLQALTSIQEMTLSFVPKIILVFVALLLLMPWMSDKLATFAEELFSRIAQGNM